MTEKAKSIPVTALKRLGSQAPEFELPVSFASLRGTVKFTLKCKALRKSEWARVRDARQREALEQLRAIETDQAASAAAADRIEVAITEIAANGMEANVQSGGERAADTVLTFASGWDLDEEFGRDGLVALEDEYGGALAACLRAYDVAIYQGVLGN